MVIISGNQKETKHFWGLLQKKQTHLSKNEFLGKVSKGRSQANLGAAAFSVRYIGMVDVGQHVYIFASCGLVGNPH